MPPPPRGSSAGLLRARLGRLARMRLGLGGAGRLLPPPPLDLQLRLELPRRAPARPGEPRWSSGRLLRPLELGLKDAGARLRARALGAEGPARVARGALDRRLGGLARGLELGERLRGPCPFGVDGGLGDGAGLRGRPLCGLGALAVAFAGRDRLLGAFSCLGRRLLRLAHRDHGVRALGLRRSVSSPNAFSRRSRSAVSRSSAAAPASARRSASSRASRSRASS